MLKRRKIQLLTDSDSCQACQFRSFEKQMPDTITISCSQLCKRSIRGNTCEKQRGEGAAVRRDRPSGLSKKQILPLGRERTLSRRASHCSAALQKSRPCQQEATEQRLPMIRSPHWSGMAQLQYHHHGQPMAEAMQRGHGLSNNTARDLQNTVAEGWGQLKASQQVLSGRER